MLVKGEFFVVGDYDDAEVILVYFMDLVDEDFADAFALVFGAHEQVMHVGVHDAGVSMGASSVFMLVMPTESATSHRKHDNRHPLLYKFAVLFKNVHFIPFLNQRKRSIFRLMVQISILSSSLVINALRRSMVRSKSFLMEHSHTVATR